MPYRLRPLIAALAHKPMLLAVGAGWGWVEVAFFPQPMLLIFLAATMFVNMLTGIMKSWKNGIHTHKEGIQKTIIKIGRYSSVLIAVWIMLNILDRMDHVNLDYTGFINGTIGFLSFVELYSIFENVEELDPGGPISFFIKPVLKFLRGRIVNNVGRMLNNSQPDKPKSDITKPDTDETDHTN